MEAQIVLGDRPVEITLQRAWEALSTGERFDLARILAQLAFQRSGMVAGGGVDGDDGDAEKVRHGKSPHPDRVYVCYTYVLRVLHSLIVSQVFSIFLAGKRTYRYIVYIFAMLPFVSRVFSTFWREKGYIDISNIIYMYYILPFVSHV